MDKGTEKAYMLGQKTWVEITTFKKDYLPDMARIFIQNFRKLRTIVPILPNLMEDTDRVIEMLAELSDVSPIIVAREGSKLLGYLGWFVVEDFRGVGRKAAYCPEWGHGAIEEVKPDIYRAMYRAAAKHWVESGCNIHALTLLAHDNQAKNTWFWNGFGMAVVDAVRSTLPLENAAPYNGEIRQATRDDINALQQMEIEHWQHYTQPPLLMDAYQPADSQRLAQFLDTPQNSIWLAMDGSNYAGYVRFEVNNTDSAAVVAAPDRIANTGAYIRRQYRGRKIAAALLDAALRDYAEQGFRCCSVDFESYNPEAVSFWLKYFEPVCFSLMRVPERQV